MKKIFTMMSIISCFFLSGCHSAMKSVDFENIILPSTPNYALAAYAGYPYPADFLVRPYKMPQKELAAKIVEILKKMPRTRCVKEDNQNYEYTFIQKTLFFRFPDWIDIKVYSIDDNTSTFVMLSRSQYGHSDFGANKKRLKYFLEVINNEVGKIKKKTFLINELRYRRGFFGINFKCHEKKTN